MVELDTILSLLQTVSIIIGVFYYIMTLQNSNKTQQLALKAQEHALETRQAQLLTGLSTSMMTSDSLFDAINYWFLKQKMDYQEFKERHPTGSDGYNKLMRTLGFYETLGLLT